MYVRTGVYGTCPHIGEKSLTERAVDQLLHWPRSCMKDECVDMCTDMSTDICINMPWLPSIMMPRHRFLCSWLSMMWYLSSIPVQLAFEDVVPVLHLRKSCSPYTL